MNLKTSITIYFIGKDFYANQTSNTHLKFFENFENFAAFLKTKLPNNNLLLIKGSRGMALEKTLDLI